jgi:hypothetical protein
MLDISEERVRLELEVLSASFLNLRFFYLRELMMEPMLSVFIF